jgi:hypothetical protein
MRAVVGCVVGVALFAHDLTSGAVIDPHLGALQPLSGIALVAPTGRGTGAMVPMSALAPAQVDARIGVRRCTAADLNAGAMGSDGLTGGAVQEAIRFGNHTATGCIVAGTPSVQLLDAHGASIPTSLQRPKQPGARQVLLAPHDGTISPGRPRRGQAVVVLFWRIIDSAGPCKPAPRLARAVQLSLPAHGGVLLVRGVAIAACHGLVGVRSCLMY